MILTINVSIRDFLRAFLFTLITLTPIQLFFSTIINEKYNSEEKSKTLHFLYLSLSLFLMFTSVIFLIYFDTLTCTIISSTFVILFFCILEKYGYKNQFNKNYNEHDSECQKSSKYESFFMFIFIVIMIIIIIINLFNNILWHKNIQHISITGYIVVSAILEEFIFRYLLYDKLLRTKLNISKDTSSIIVSLIFAIILQLFNTGIGFMPICFSVIVNTDCCREYESNGYLGSVIAFILFNSTIIIASTFILQ